MCYLMFVCALLLSLVLGGWLLFGVDCGCVLWFVVCCVLFVRWLCVVCLLFMVCWLLLVAVCVLSPVDC